MHQQESITTGLRLGRTSYRHEQRVDRPLPSLLRRLGCTLGSLVLLHLAPSCANLNAYSVNDDVSMGQEAYTQFLEEAPTLQAGAEVDQAKRVTDRLVASAEAFDPDIVHAFAENWEVTVIDDDETVNAFCLPGGKMAIYTGILPVAQTDAGLAVVMGHEIAHATRRHGTEAVTRQMGLAFAVEMASGQADPEMVAQGLNLLITLPYGRDAELEADAAGLMYLAGAGYDPREAVSFWTRMADLGGEKPPEWLSTHPADQTRIDQLEALMPRALEIYEAAKAGQ